MSPFSRARSQWLDFMLETVDRSPPRMMWDVIAEMLAQQLDAPVAGDFGWGRQGQGKVRAYPMPESFDLEGVGARAPRLHPIATAYARTSERTVLTTSMVEPPEAPGAPDYMAELRELGIDQQLWIPVSVLEGGPQVVGACRARHEYSRTEIQIAQFAQRVLLPLHRHVTVLAGARAVQWSECAQELRLTARQVAVLQLVAEGLTARATARRLHVSPRTVHRHLENAYRRLQVTDRVTAVRRAQAAGLLQLSIE